jgi:hypothetical protein
MGADKNSSRRRLKLQQDELARSDHQNHTFRTSTFRLPKPRSHWSATSPMKKHYQQHQLPRTHDRGNNSKAGCPEGAVRPSMGAVRPGMGGGWTTSTRQPRNPPRHLFRAQKRTTVSPTEISGQGHASYQKILTKTKTSPRGLGAVRPAIRGGLTSCTQQRTPSKNS